MSLYLLDTNICIFFLRGKHNLDQKFHSIGIENCCISEITVAELKFGAHKSNLPQNIAVVEEFINKFSIIPIFSSLDVYAMEKTRLNKAGTPIDDFDLLIGASARANNLILVTNNTSHFNRFNDLILEDWTK